MSKKMFDMKRAKQLRLVVSEERALEIVRPLIDVTAYVLSIKRVDEVPDIESFKNMVLPSKISLAKLMAAKLKESINPGNLSITTVEAVMVGGYFNLSVKYSTNKKNDHGEEIVNCYNVKLVNENGILLHDCLRAKKEKELGRKLTDNEVTSQLQKIIDF